MDGEFSTQIMSGSKLAYVTAWPIVQAPNDRSAAEIEDEIVPRVASLSFHRKERPTA
jgi:hypothetical protein